jgi:hypothetical protein
MQKAQGIGELREWREERDGRDERKRKMSWEKLERQANTFSDLNGFNDFNGLNDVVLLRLSRILVRHRERDRYP